RSRSPSRCEPVDTQLVSADSRAARQGCAGGLVAGTGRLGGRRHRAGTGPYWTVWLNTSGDRRPLMTRRWVFPAVIGLLGLALGLGLGTAIGQQAPPTETKGQKIPMTVSMDLGPEIEGMQGWQLRLRVLELEP